MFEDIPYICCDKKFKSLYDLYDHKDTHTEEDKSLVIAQKAAALPEENTNNSIPTDLLMKKVFTCSYCSKSYASHSGLKNHLTKVHNKSVN